MSNSLTSYILTFSAGAAVGSIVAWRMLKTKYEAIAREEIASVKEVFANRVSTRSNTESNEDKLSREREGYSNVLKEEGYTNYSDIKNEKKGEADLGSGGPYVIAPEEFATLDDYETSNLTYYADGVIADDLDEPLKDAEHIVGPDIGSHFGEYEDDAVHVRNDELKIDYEILRDMRSFVDVVGVDPHGSDE